ncbi:phosphoribosyl-AMP cyclohydrolase [Spirochaetota bacterium]
MVELDFNKLNGIIPVITQDHKTLEVLMLAFMNKEAWDETLKKGEAVYFSRSRGKLWHKGETSGHVQKIKEILIDCDNDTLLLKVDQVGGAACHTGYNSCFYRKVEKNDIKIIKDKKIFNPDEVYK